MPDFRSIVEELVLQLPSVGFVGMKKYLIPILLPKDFATSITFLSNSSSVTPFGGFIGIIFHVSNIVFCHFLIIPQKRHPPKLYHHDFYPQVFL